MPWGLYQNYFFLIKLVLFQINDQCFGKYFKKEQCKNISMIGLGGLRPWLDLLWVVRQVPPQFSILVPLVEGFWIVNRLSQFKVKQFCQF